MKFLYSPIGTLTAYGFTLEKKYVPGVIGNVRMLILYFYKWYRVSIWQAKNNG